MQPTQEIVPSAQPRKKVLEIHPLSHDSRALHPTHVSEKSSGKRFISKSVAAPPEVYLFPDGKARSKILHTSLISQLNDLIVSPLQAPTLLPSISDQDKVSVKHLFESDSNLMERLKDIVEKIVSIKGSAPTDSSFDALFKRLQIESKENNMIQRDIASLAKGVTSDSKTKKSILTSFDLIERNVLGISKQDQQLRLAKSLERSSSSTPEIIRLNSGTTDTETSSIGVERLSEIKHDINNSLQSYIAQKGIEIITFNLERSRQQAESPSEEAYYNAFISDIKKASADIEAKSQTEYMTAGQRLEELYQTPKFETLLQSNTTFKSLFEAYSESVSLSEKNGYVSKILDALPAELSAKELNTFMKELEKVAEFPLRRAIYLKESADAEKEVFAQELIRALAPTIAIAANPYPKYRLATNSITENSGLGIVPIIPKVLVASEQISFDSRSIGYAQKDNNGQLHSNITPASDIHLVHQKDDLAGRRLIPMESIPGFGATMQFAKFLGNTDAKPGNIGLRLGNGEGYPTMVTNLDSGLCFKVNPQVFKDSNEVATPDLLTKEDVCNYFYQRAGWQHYDSLTRFYQESIEHPQVKKENRITALHIALIPPEIYEVFAKQYVSKEENPFLRNNDRNPDFFENEGSFDTIVRQHIIEKGDATFHNFLKDDRLFGYFLESGRAPQENIFQVFQNLMVQLEAFRFYEKHDFQSALDKEKVDTPLYDMVESRFLSLMSQKLESATPEQQKIMKKLLTSWDPKQVQLDSHVAQKDGLKGTHRANELTTQAIERGNALKTKFSEIIRHKESANLLEIGRMNSPRTSSVSKLDPLTTQRSQILRTKGEVTIGPQNQRHSGLRSTSTLERRGSSARLPSIKGR